MVSVWLLEDVFLWVCQYWKTTTAEPSRYLANAFALQNLWRSACLFNGCQAHDDAYDFFPWIRLDTIPAPLSRTYTCPALIARDKAWYHMIDQCPCTSWMSWLFQFFRPGQYLSMGFRTVLEYVQLGKIALPDHRSLQIIMQWWKHQMSNPNEGSNLRWPALHW